MEYSLLDFATGTAKQKIKDYVSIVDDNPIIRVIDDDEMIYVTNKAKDFLGIFLTSEGNTCTKVTFY